MLWLEMSRDPVHGAGDWEFTRSLWSPTHKKGGTASWAFWETLMAVRRGDTILHLRGKSGQAAFIGTSTADSDGFTTPSRPPIPGPWGYANSFYRVQLREFTPFADQIPLPRVFAERALELRSYFQQNAVAPKTERRHLFYVLQSGRLQCLNGAYLSEVDRDLARIIFGSDFGVGPTATRPPYVSVLTGEQVQTVAARVGQQAFSAAVRSNYGGRCCFPGCSINDGRFLVGAHIARWADAPTLRGEVSNGLCLCLVHDRAFELGMFTLTPTGEVVIPPQFSPLALWLADVSASGGARLQCPPNCVQPSETAIRKHWARIGFQPV